LLARRFLRCLLRGLLLLLLDDLGIVGLALATHV
jgi:hypothetical protein